MSRKQDEIISRLRSVESLLELRIREVENENRELRRKLAEAETKLKAREHWTPKPDTPSKWPTEPYPGVWGKPEPYPLPRVWCAGGVIPRKKCGKCGEYVDNTTSV